MSEHHIVPLRVYFGVFIALMVLTALTVGVAYFNFGSLNILVAMAIAIVKATLVILFFMHVWYSSKLTKMIVAAGLFWLAILLIMTLVDYAVRTGWPTPLGSVQEEAAVPAHVIGSGHGTAAPAAGHGSSPSATSGAHGAIENAPPKEAEGSGTAKQASSAPSTTSTETHGTERQTTPHAPNH